MSGDGPERRLIRKMTFRARTPRWAALFLAVCMSFSLAACAGESQPTGTGATSSTGPTTSALVGASPSEGSSPSGGAAQPPSASAPNAKPPAARNPGTVAQETAKQQLKQMSLEQRAGQLFMSGVPAAGTDETTLALLKKHHLGNVMLTGRSSRGVTATAGIVRQLESGVSKAGAGGVPLFVATDQEGGNVQVLTGPGFAMMPSALTQGSWTPSRLRATSGTWGRQLAAAGVNVNLAPVADTVPGAAFAPENIPIGRWDREYGYSPAVVSRQVKAFSRGMRSADVAPVVKHFPGLGRVSANTDIAVGVTDHVTTRNDPYLAPFLDAVHDGANWVMVSSARYAKIDPDHIAPFSSTIMEDMLRTKMGFNGIIISDDLCAAEQLSPWPVGTRAVKFLGAGGTMALCIDAQSTAVMQQAVVRKARTSPAFADTVDAAALKVLEAKARL